MKPVAPYLVFLVELKGDGAEIGLDEKAMVWKAVSKTAAWTASDKILRATRIPVRLAALCNGVRGTHASMSAMTRSSMSVVS
jgi:hypothetical protein